MKFHQAAAHLYLIKQSKHPQTHKHAACVNTLRPEGELVMGQANAICAVYQTLSKQLTQIKPNIPH